MKDEIWLPVVDYPQYHVSNLKRVKRIARLSKNGIDTIPEKLLSTTHYSGKYEKVTLSNDGKLKTFNIENLYQIAFLGKPLEIKYRQKAHYKKRLLTW